MKKEEKIESKVVVEPEQTLTPSEILQSTLKQQAEHHTVPTIKEEIQKVK